MALGLPPDELAARTDHTELVELDAYELIAGPQTAARADVQAGVVASTVANVQRDPKKRAKPYSAGDFIPQWDQASRGPASSSQLLSKMKAIAAAQNAGRGGS